LTDAAAARGKAYGMTWPRDRRIVPPLVRIDHVLTTRGLVVTHLAVGTGKGSDHRPLVADVAVVAS
jgi:endonuclease/exonuclease/phosphatase family metal-dependent hydrolase